jgi:hypothetical protein
MKRTRLSICQHKVRYPSFAEAQSAALAFPGAARPYRCDKCRRFHLTSRRRP